MHGSEFQYTDKQDVILGTLAQQQLKEGTYLLPTAPPGSSSEEHQKVMENSAGKPWAQISYHESYNTAMGLNMVRGFAVDLLAAFLLIWVLSKIQNLDFKTALLAALAVGATGYLTIPYLNSVWFETNSLGYLADTIVQWGLVGAWLGLWMTRK